MKILYGVAGEGYGHASRSKEIIDQLLKKHKVIVACGGKAYPYLKTHSNTTKIYSHIILYKNNSVMVLLTFLLWLFSHPLFFLLNTIKLIKIIKSFKPDIIITDFEPFTCYVANILGIPCISIDNQHITTRAKVEYNRFIDKFNSDVVIKTMIPRADKYLITTFFYPTIIKKDTILIPPIINRKFKRIKETNGKHILVYQTSKTYYKEFIPILKTINEKFVIYGFNKKEIDKNLTFRLFNEGNFAKDLSQSKAVITNGGLTLMSEALHLNKPVLSVPIKKHFEQFTNAYYLDKLRLGKYVEELNKENIEEFLKNVKAYKEKIKEHNKKSKRFDINEFLEKFEL